jgi:hypothetical protein
VAPSSSAGIGEIYIFAVLGAFVSKNTAKSLQVPDQLPPLHLHLKLLDDDFALRQFGQVDGLSNHANGIDKILPCFF